MEKSTLLNLLKAIDALQKGSSAQNAGGENNGGDPSPDLFGSNYGSFENANGGERGGANGGERGGANGGSGSGFGGGFGGANDRRGFDSGRGAGEARGGSGGFGGNGVNGGKVLNGGSGSAGAPTGGSLPSGFVDMPNFMYEALVRHEHVRNRIKKRKE